MILSLLFAFVLFPEPWNDFFWLCPVHCCFGGEICQLPYSIYQSSASVFRYFWIFSSSSVPLGLMTENYILSQIWDHKEKWTFFMSHCLPTLLYHVFLGPERAKYNFLKVGYTTLSGLKVKQLSVFQVLSRYHEQVSTWLSYKESCLAIFLLSFPISYVFSLLAGIWSHPKVTESWLPNL